jgi:hypothetical protein
MSNNPIAESVTPFQFASPDGIPPPDIGTVPEGQKQFCTASEHMETSPEESIQDRSDVIDAEVIVPPPERMRVKRGHDGDGSQGPSKRRKDTHYVDPSLPLQDRFVFFCCLWPERAFRLTRKGSVHRLFGKHWKVVCPHGVLKAACRECEGSQICQHGAVRSSCGNCRPCQHGIPRSACDDCREVTCTHGKKPQSCISCAMSQIFEHNGLCPHGVRRHGCSECREGLFRNLQDRLTGRHKRAATIRKNDE